MKDTIFIYWIVNYILNTRTKLRSDDQTPKIQQRSTKHQTEITSAWPKIFTVDAENKAQNVKQFKTLKTVQF